MDDTKKTFAERLLEQIKRYEKFDRYNTYMLSMYRHLFEMLIIKAPEALDHMYQEVDTKFDEAFFKFHKGFRQWDTFIDYHVKIKTKGLTEEEHERLKVLQEKMKNRPDNWLKDPEYLKIYEEKQELDRVYYDDGRRSIGGHLDMLLWNLIHIDKTGVMYNTLEAVMDDLKIEKVNN